MKIPILLISSLFFLFINSAGKAVTKIIALTSVPKEKLIVIRGETGKQEFITSWRKDNKSFFIVSNNPDTDSILLKNDYSVKLYQPASKKTTSWIKSPKINKISLAECFVKFFEKKISLPEFIVPNYISETLYDPEKRLRNEKNESSFFSKQLFEFTSVKKISFPCLDSVKVTEICIKNFLSDNEVYRSDKISAQSEINTNLKLQEGKLFIYKINYFTENDEIKIDSAFLRICPIIFSQKSYIFNSKDSVKFRWKTSLPKINLSVTKANGKTVFKTKNYTKRIFNLENIKSSKIKANKVYKLKVTATHNNKEIIKTISFCFLLSKNENKRLTEFIMPKIK